jgi:hypothetical protein
VWLSYYLSVVRYNSSSFSQSTYHSTQRVIQKHIFGRRVDSPSQSNSRNPVLRRLKLAGHLISYLAFWPPDKLIPLWHGINVSGDSEKPK